jgi:hypothetical protein
MFSSRSDRPSVPGYHPEFGLLCPSPRRRRVMRLGVLSIATTIAIGATMGLAVARWPDRDGLAATAEPMNERSQVPAAAIEAVRAHESCKTDPTGDLAAFFLKTACGSSKPHARHAGRAANRVATVIIGRTDIAPEPTEVAPPPAAANEPSEVAALERANPAKAKAGAPIANALPAAEMGRWNAMFNSYASTAASRIGRESYDSHGDTFRSAALHSGFADPFSRSWSQWR